MSDLDAARAQISTIIDDIEQVPAEFRKLCRQDDDCEAYEIVRRIQRRLDRDRVAKPQPQQETTA